MTWDKYLSNLEAKAHDTGRGTNLKCDLVIAGAPNGAINFCLFSTEQPGLLSLHEMSGRETQVELACVNPCDPIMEMYA